LVAHVQKGSISVDAFQWLGGTLSTSTVVLPIWAKQLALHSPGDGTLHVPCGPGQGTLAANPTDWVVQTSPGSTIIDILPNSLFTVMFN
jgi:hypothetical protein